MTFYSTAEGNLSLQEAAGR